MRRRRNRRRSAWARNIGTGAAGLLADYPIPILLPTDVFLNLNGMLIAVDQLPISAVLGSLPISYSAYSAPYFRYPRSVHYRRSTTRLSQPSSYRLFSHFPYYPLYPSARKSINYPPPNYLSSDQPSTDICYLSPLSYNNCGHHRSLPHATSYFRSIGSHDHRVSRLASSRSPSSFDLDRSFLFR